MQYRVSLCKDNNSTQKGSLREDSLLVSVSPVLDGYGFRDYIEYSQIRDDLNIKTLREIAKTTGHPIEVFENKDYFIWQFPKKPRIYISKKDWKLYAIADEKGYQLQAFNVLRRLAKFGYVLDYKRVQYRRRELYGIGV
jgi:hypothetical protein